MEQTGWHTQIKRGLLEMCILNLLAREQLYGYQLSKKLTAIPGLVVTEGTIYPLISRLKRDGLLKTNFVESPHGPVRKVYELSADGERRRKDINEMWKEVSHSINELIIVN